MKHFLFFGIPLLFLQLTEICTIFILPTPFADCFSCQSVKIKPVTYFTDFYSLLDDVSISKDASVSSKSSYEKLFFSQLNSSPQQDTTKKKLMAPDKGQGAPKQQQIALNEIDGLVIDATFSPGGYDFYIDFSQNWTPPIGAANYTVLIKEYQGRGTNITVAIEVNGKQLVYRRMRPIYPAIHGLSVAAASYLNGYITRGDHLRGIDADGNFIDVQQAGTTRQIKTPFDIY